MWAINQSWGYTINYLRLYSLNYCISCGQKIKCCICNNWNVDICIFKLKRQSIIWVFVNSVLQRSATLFCHVIWYQQLLIGGYMYLCRSCCPWGLSGSLCYRNTSLQWAWPDTWSHMTAADSRFYLKKQSTTCLHFLEIYFAPLILNETNVSSSVTQSFSA